MRARTAASAAPSEMRRQHQCSSPPRPETGSQPSSTPNTIASSGPSQKFGIDTPASDSVIAAWSTTVPRQTAAAIPAESRRRGRRAIAAKASSMVAGMRSRIWRRPVCPCGATCRDRRAPARRGRRRTAPASGRSRPSCRRSCATSASEATSPRIARAGSPGMKWISAKTSVATPSSTGIVSRRRRARLRQHGVSLSLGPWSPVLSL